MHRQMVFDTLHAVTMTSTQGTEILIHIGLDTVTLKGEPFTPHVVAGDKVKQGDLLMEVDLDKIQVAGLNTITPVLICNTDTYGKIAFKRKAKSHWMMLYLNYPKICAFSIEANWNGPV